MEGLLFILGVLVGGGLAWMLRRRQAKPAALVAPDEQPPTLQAADATPAEAPADSGSTKRLYEIADGLEDFFNQAAHPRDLIEHPDVQRGVAVLTHPRYSQEDLLAYYQGDNERVAVFALEALRQRGDPIEPQQILDHVDHLYYEEAKLYFALGTLAERAEGDVLSPVLCRVAPWWSEYSSVMQRLNTLVSERWARGERLTLEETLDADQLGNLKALLEKLSAPEASTLWAGVEAWEAGRVDTRFFEQIGRVWGIQAYRDPKNPMLSAPYQQEVVAMTTALLQQKPARSVLLVGQPGTGKTAVVKQVALELQAQGWTIFEADGSDLTAGQMYFGQLEERMQKLLENLGEERRVLWVIPNLHGLLYAGRHKHQPTGLLEDILPLLERGKIRVLAEIHPGAYERLLQAQPRLRTALHVASLAPASPAAAKNLAAAWEDHVGEGTPLLPAGMATEALQLAQQYLTDQALPGNLMRLLKLTHQRRNQDRQPPLPLTLDDLLVTLATLTGLPLGILDDRQRLDLGDLRQHFEQRVFGQPEAIEVLVQRIAMIKAGLTDPSRPAGVFLFVGPTGTGKTEIAKALATYLFGAPERMIRLDMSEFKTPESLARLYGAHEKETGQASLVSQVRKQPFSVVLLDEFEKADPAVWDLFLQVFDDARLTDPQGNTADFRHTIILLTSNLGAALPRGAQLGFGEGHPHFSAAGVERAVTQAFRPEFLNRLDRVIVFRPLSRQVMRGILQKELAAVLERRGFRSKAWAVEWEDSALEFLLDQGFSLDLGARPLKRAIERHLLAPLAEAMVAHDFPEGDQFLFVRSAGERLDVVFIDPDAPEAEPPAPVPEGLSLARMMVAPAGHGGEIERLQQVFDAVQETFVGAAWETRKTEALAALGAPGFWDQEDRFIVLDEIEYMDRIEAAAGTAQGLLERFERRPQQVPKDVVSRLAQQLFLVEKAIDGWADRQPHDAFVRIEVRGSRRDELAQAHGFAQRLFEMYQQWALARRMRWRVLQPPPPESERFLVDLAISGLAAFPLLELETGMHLFEQPQEQGERQRWRVTVRVLPQPLPLSSIPEEQAAAAGQLFMESPVPTEIVRYYRDAPSPLVRDRRQGWRTGRVDWVWAGHFDLMAALVG